MAVSSGAAAHFAWLSVNGLTIPIERGSVDQEAANKTSTFKCHFPMDYPGALETLATLGQNSASVFVQSTAGAGQLIQGQIDDVDFDFLGTNISVSGRDQSAALHATKSSASWLNLPGSQIVQQLAGQAGLGVAADPSPLPAGKQVNIDYARISDGISIAAVIEKLAQFDGARWWVQNGILNYRMLNNPIGIYTLNYVPPTPGNPMVADFLRLNIKVNIPASQSIQVQVKSWHPRQQQVFLGNATAGGRVAGVVPYVFHIPNLMQDHAQQYAQSKANEVARHGLTLTADVVGDPTIDVAMGLLLTGTGYFDSMYQIDTVHHEFGMRGYTMVITAKLPSGGSSGAGAASATTAAPTQQSLIAGGGTP